MSQRFTRGLAIASMAACLTATAADFPDATVLDPDYHKVVLENEHVRVLESRASPGAKSHMHSHPPRIIVSMSAARLKAAFPDGKVQIWDLHPQELLWMPADAHQWEVLAGEISAYVIEVKSAAKAK